MEWCAPVWGITSKCESPYHLPLCVLLTLVFILVQTNTFQGIVITNGQQSYALFTYQCGQLGWSGGATIGFTAAGNVYQNNRLSGTYARNIACLNSPTTIWTNVIYQLSKYGYMHDGLLTILPTLDDNYLPFFELGVTPGVARNYLPRTINASSTGINVPGGFSIGTSNQMLVYVCRNTSCLCHVEVTDNIIRNHSSLQMVTSHLEGMHTSSVQFYFQNQSLTTTS